MKITKEQEVEGKAALLAKFFRVLSESKDTKRDLSQSMILKDLIEAQEKVRATHGVDNPKATSSKKGDRQSILDELDLIPISTMPENRQRQFVEVEEEEDSFSEGQPPEKRKKTRYSETMWQGVEGNFVEDEDTKQFPEILQKVEPELSSTEESGLPLMPTEQSHIATSTKGLLTESEDKNVYSAQQSGKVQDQNVKANSSQIWCDLTTLEDDELEDEDRVEQEKENKTNFTADESKLIYEETRAADTRIDDCYKNEKVQDKVTYNGEEDDEKMFSSECSILENFDAWEAKKRAL